MFKKLRNGKLKYVFEITPALRKKCNGMNRSGDAYYVTHRCPNCEPPRFIRLMLEAGGKIVTKENRSVSMSICDRHPWPEPERKEYEGEIEGKDLPRPPTYGSYAK